MPFKHKLSVRLAVARTLLVAFVGATLSCGDVNVASPTMDTAIADELVDLVISPSSATLTVNDSLDFQAYGITAVGDSVEVTVMWTTVEDGTTSTDGSTKDNSFKGKGKAKGRFKAEKSGEYDLIAEVDSTSLADTAEVTVVDPVVADVIVDPSSAVLDVGQSVSLTVSLEDSSGNALSDREVMWSSSDMSVATVDSAGLVTGGASGQASIIAESERVADTATISVQEEVTEVISAPSITTTTLSDGIVGQNYSQSLTATGGDGVYSWSLTGGRLPAGITLATDGTVSGTPTETGTSSFGVVVTSAEKADSASFAVTIDPEETVPSNLVLSYGFEDWTGDAETTPGYVFRIGGESVWDRQLSASEVVSSCEGRTAHSGNYFWRRRMDQNHDPCLATTPLSENSYIRFGNGDATYPLGSGDTTDLRTDIKGEVMTFRFWFRLTGNWPATGIDMNWSKFVRSCFGNADYEHDDACGHIMLHQNATRFAIWDTPTADWYYQDVGDLDDGQWHSLTIVHTRLNQTLTSRNYNITYWLDDWDMEGSPTQDVDISVPEAGTSPFRMIALFVNYGGSSNPTNEHAIEYDDFEIWDGLPN